MGQQTPQSMRTSSTATPPHSTCRRLLGGSSRASGSSSWLSDTRVASPAVDCVLPRRLLEALAEGEREVALAAEAQRARDLSDLATTGGKTPCAFLEALAEHVLMRRDAERFAEELREATRSHSGEGCELAQCELLAEA